MHQQGLCVKQRNLTISILFFKAHHSQYNKFNCFNSIPSPPHPRIWSPFTIPSQLTIRIHIRHLTFVTPGENIWQKIVPLLKPPLKLTCSRAVHKHLFPPHPPTHTLLVGDTGSRLSKLKKNYEWGKPYNFIRALIMQSFLFKYGYKTAQSDDITDHYTSSLFPPPESKMMDIILI